MSVKVTVRNAVKSDIPCITSNWLKSFRKGDMNRGVGNDLYYKWHHKVVDELLDRSHVIMLCDAGNPDHIIGWVCAEVSDQAVIVHYVYVKYTHRKNGFARALVNVLLESEKPAMVLYTHKTGGCRFALEHLELDKEWVYNPYWLMASLRPGWSGLLPITKEDKR